MVHFVNAVVALAAVVHAQDLLRAALVALHGVGVWFLFGLFFFLGGSAVLNTHPLLPVFFVVNTVFNGAEVLPADDARIAGGTGVFVAP